MKLKMNIRRMVISAILVAIGLVLPFITGQIPAIAKIISPMHIPVLIGGLTCGPAWGAGIGFILPLLRGVMFGMPALIPNGLSMAFELCTYGLLTGILYPVFLKLEPLKKHQHLPAILLAMLIAMVAGRLVGGAAQAIILGATGKGYTFEMFVTAYFVTTLPGALIHLAVIPAIVVMLEKTKLSCVNECLMGF